MPTPSTQVKPGDLYTPADPLAPPFQLDANPDPYTPPPSGQGFAMYQPDPNTRGTAIYDGTSGTGPGSAAAASKQASLNGLLQQSSMSGSTGAPAAGAPPVTMGDTSAGTAAAFGRAKDQTGLNTRASLRAFQDQMAGNQMMGSGLEMTGTRDIVEHGAGQLNEVMREQAVKDATLNNSRVMADYQGRVTQRGQDLSVAQSNADRQAHALQSIIQSMGILY